VSVCVTGATGFIGAHVAKLVSERLGPPRVTYRDERRLGETNIVDVRDVAKGHLLAAERGSPGERYVLSGHGAPPSPLSVAAAGVQLARRAGLLGGLRAAERRVDRRLVAP
jgi:nucleoside-diphosphate-sugar epimerase